MSMLGLEDLVLECAIVAEGDGERDAVDVPGTLESDAGGGLILNVYEPGVAGLVLEAGGPVHDVGVAEIGVAPEGGAGAIVGAGVGNGAVGVDGVFDLGAPNFRFRDLLIFCICILIIWNARIFQNPLIFLH